MAQRYDLVLKGGEVLDPSQGLRGVQDVAFRDGKVAEIVPGSAVDGARQVIDVSGKLVTPGLIDVHGHYYNHVVPFATAADEVCLPNGVTTTVDAGSSGWTHFDGFREYILTREKTRLMALVNLSALGMLDPHRDGGFGPTTMTISGGPKTMFPDNAAGELMDLRFAQSRRDHTVHQGQPQRRHWRQDSAGRQHQRRGQQHPRSGARETGGGRHRHVHNGPRRASPHTHGQGLRIPPARRHRHPHLPQRREQHPRRHGERKDRGSRGEVQGHRDGHRRHPGQLRPQRLAGGHRAAYASRTPSAPT